MTFHGVGVDFFSGTALSQIAASARDTSCGASLDTRVLYREMQLMSHEKKDGTDNLPLSSRTVHVCSQTSVYAKQ